MSQNSTNSFFKSTANRFSALHIQYTILLEVLGLKINSWYFKVVADFRKVLKSHSYCSSVILYPIKSCMSWKGCNSLIQSCETSLSRRTTQISKGRKWIYVRLFSFHMQGKLQAPRGLIYLWAVRLARNQTPLNSKLELPELEEEADE